MRLRPRSRVLPPSGETVISPHRSIRPPLAVPESVRGMEGAGAVQGPGLPRVAVVAAESDKELTLRNLGSALT